MWVNKDEFFNVAGLVKWIIWHVMRCQHTNCVGWEEGKAALKARLFSLKNVTMCRNWKYRIGVFGKEVSMLKLMKAIYSRSNANAQHGCEAALSVFRKSLHNSASDHVSDKWDSPWQNTPRNTVLVVFKSQMSIGEPKLRPVSQH